jgi:class 3 adenylate cyclase
MDEASGKAWRHRAAWPGRARGRRHAVVVHGDIVGSTGLIERAGDRYADLLLRHRELIAGAVRRRGGRFLSHAGDGTMAVFDRPAAALRAAADAQRALADEPWPEGLAVRVRMGVHAGEVTEIEGEPVGLAINHGARIMGVARAGQVVVSDAVVAALDAGDEPKPDLALADAGCHSVRDHGSPVHLLQMVAEGLTVVVPERRPLVAA